MNSFPVNLPIYVSPLEPIRSALGDLGYAHIFQTMEPDLVRWVIDAQDLISRAKTFKWTEQEYQVEDNKIQYCAGLKMVECVSMGGIPLTYDPTRSCGSCCTSGCSKSSGCGPQQWLADEVYIHFDPVVQDGQKVVVKGLARPYGKDGYPLVNECCLIAIVDYVSHKICFRMGDNRSAECKQNWLYRCRTARAELNRYSQQQLQAIGLLWYAPRFQGSYLGASASNAINGMLTP